LHTAEGGRAQSVHGRPLYRLCTRPCTGHVHGPSVTVYTAVFTAVYYTCLRPVCTAVYVPCIWPCTRPITACTHRVHRRATAVYIVRPRPCTGYTYTVMYSVHGRVYGPCTRPPTAVYRLCTRLCTGHVHGPSVTRSRPCAQRQSAVYREQGRLYGPCARHCTYRIHGRSRRVRIVYTGVQGSCTWCVHGYVQGTPTPSGTLYTDLFTARVHGHSRPCIDCLHGRARATYMVRP